MLLLINIIFFLSIIAPDYLGLLVKEPANNYFYYLPVIASTLYFCIRHQSEEKSRAYFLRILWKQILVIVVPLLLLLPLSFRIDTMRCQQTGFCTGGEPFDNMSTIFLILFAFTFLIRAFFFTMIIGGFFRIYRKIKLKNLKSLAKKKYKEGEVKIIGVYNVPKKKNVHLIEILINTKDKYEIGEFTQEDPTADRLSWQAPYDECYLDYKGIKLRKSKTNRFAFYFHYLDFNRKLLTPFGLFELPKSRKLPKRLNICPKYIPVD